MPGHSQAAIAAYPELGDTGMKLELLTCWGVNDDVLKENNLEYLGTDTFEFN